MTLLEIIRQAQADTLIDEDGDVVTLELLPGLSQTELRDFADRMPCPLPPEITELLGACSGLEGIVDQVEFTGKDLMFELGPAFPHGLPIAHDGFGNFWVVDLHPHSTMWGPIYFVCHDAPVILYQSDSLEEFLTERWLFLGTLRSEHADRALPNARRVRLPEAEKRHLPALRARGSIGLFTMSCG